MIPDPGKAEILRLASEAGHLSDLLAVLAERLDGLSGKCPATVQAVFAGSFIAETLCGRMNKLAEALP